jgi:hypothetical protein
MILDNRAEILKNRNSNSAAEVLVLILLQPKPEPDGNLRRLTAVLACRDILKVSIWVQGLARYNETMGFHDTSNVALSTAEVEVTGQHTSSQHVARHCIV